MSRNPPNDRARADMFLSSVRSYESLAGNFELAVRETPHSAVGL